MSDNSGEINLNSLASPTSDPRWTVDGGDMFEYSYNPCIGFSSPQFENLAVSNKTRLVLITISVTQYKHKQCHVR